MVLKLIKRLINLNNELKALHQLVESYKELIDSLKTSHELSKQNSNIKIDFLLKKLEEFDTKRPYPGVM